MSASDHQKEEHIMNELKIAVLSGGAPVGTITIHNVYNKLNLEFWSPFINSGELELNGCYHRYDEETNEIVYEGTAGPGCKCDGCSQNDCGEPDCQFCGCHTMGPEEYLQLPVTATFEEAPATKIDDTLLIELSFGELYSMTNAMIYMADKLATLRAPKIVVDTTIKRAEKLNWALKMAGQDYWPKERFMEVKQKADYRDIK